MARLTGNWIPAALARSFGAPPAAFFHGVESQIVDPRIQINQHRLDAFENMARLMKHDFDVLPLDALSDVLRHPERNRRALFLMSDDGYANALTGTADILAAFALPWTLFVSTHHVDTGELNPMTIARSFFLLASAGRYEIPHFHGLLPRYGLASEESNLAAFLPVLRTDNAQLRQWQSRIGT